MVEKVDVHAKLAGFSEAYSPRVIGALNGQEVKVAKLRGPFTWHQHEHEDELFLVVRGRFRMELRDRTLELGEGELVIIPRGTEHRPVADEECHVLLFEPAGTLNTGNVRDRFTVDAPARI